ncbi:hypothetical protein L6164_031030 [Bauhinia variegata]|uniref:Uncharacterized protein n=1 Tax=Bauhinia variegata TaxID=167791 RepID=A0ACB9LFI8_BAUVA|nr:hypothetical protein L6164_031030 [Bauhinia variegata]
MDISEYTRIVRDKIQKFEPELATKILGYLLLQDNGERDVVKLASCEDHLIREVAFKAKAELQRFANKSAINQISIPVSPQQGLSHLSARTPTSSASLQVPSSIWDSHSPLNTSADFLTLCYMDSIPEFQKQPQMLSLENHLDHVNVGSAAIGNDYYGIDNTATGNLNGRTGRRFSSPSEFPVKTCHFFNKGFCRHGSSCRYYHGQIIPESSSQAYGNDASKDDQMILLGSLAQLEAEIVELLKPRRGNPMSIASLPMAYYDKYNKVLQAEGYLTESQRHGKSGYSLTKLLARLKNSIRLIDRPHGQHAVILAEDAPKYMEKGDPGQSISASRQIYLTFPADSTFTEEDVSNYFNKFGCVEDVRIPCQQRRMFGFVTFVDPSTVKTILDMENPHTVGGSRVLVKPYREKSKLVDRKYSDRIEHHPDCYSPHYVDMDFELSSMTRACGNSRFMRRQLMEEQEQALEFQRRRLAELQMAQKSLGSSPKFGFSMDGLKVPEDCFNFQPAECFSYGRSDTSRYIDTSYTDEESQGLNLPDSPFAFPVDNGISAVI